MGQVEARAVREARTSKSNVKNVLDWDVTSDGPVTAKSD
jgi:hypothetical protein